MKAKILGGVVRLTRAPLVGAAQGARVLGRTVRRDVVDGGHGRIVGTISIEGQVASRCVRLFDARSGRMLRQTWSAANGHYEFNYIDPARDYFVLAHDHAKQFNAVVADSVKAEAML